MYTKNREKYIFAAYVGFIALCLALFNRDLCSYFIYLGAMSEIKVCNERVMLLFLAGALSALDIAGVIYSQTAQSARSS